MADSIEEPRWELIENIGEVEIRNYAPCIQAVTELPRSSASSSGFRRLAGFIFGKNATGESIAMTAPVQETLGTERPLMTFTMPAAYSMQDLPAPNDERVRLVEVPEKTVASLSFSGWATGGRVASMRDELLMTLESNDVEVVGQPILNQYNPPWTPPFMRRNEISVEVRYEM